MDRQSGGQGADGAREPTLDRVTAHAGPTAINSGTSSPTWLGRYGYALAILSVTIIGLLHRLRDVGTMHMYFDELAVWINVQANDAALAEGAGLKILLSWVTAWWGKADPLGWRLVLVLVSSMAIPVVAALGRRLGGRAVGLIAAVLFAGSPMAWRYAPQIRPYGIYLLFTALLYDGFLAAHQQDRLRDWARYGGALFLCCMTHLVTALIAVPLGVVSIAGLVKARQSAQGGAGHTGRFLRFLVVSVVAGGVGILWWIIRTRGRPMGLVAGRYPDGVLLFLQDALLNLGPVAGYPDGLHPAAIPALVMFGLATLGGIALRRSRPEASALFALCFAFTLVVMFFTLGVKGTWSWSRYITHLLPFYLALIAVAVVWLAERSAEKLRGKGPRWLQGRLRAVATVALGMVVVVMFAPAWVYTSRAGYRASEGAQYPAMSDLVWQNQAELRGVIVLGPGSVDTRSLAAFFLHKKDRLPTFTTRRGELHQVSLGEAVFSFQKMPRWGPPLEAMPPDGIYAIVGRTPLTSCTQLTSVHVRALIGSRETVKESGLFCELTFKRHG